MGGLKEYDRRANETEGGGGEQRVGEGVSEEGHDGGVWTRKT